MARRPVVWIAVVAVVVVAAVLPTAALVSRSRFGTFAFWGLPDRIDYCGRRYVVADDDRSATPAELADEVDAPTEWRTVARTLTLRSVEAPVLLERGDRPCAMVLYVETGASRYRAYVLSGGP